jgi:hypothetical protein
MVDPVKVTGSKRKACVDKTNTGFICIMGI